MKLAVYIYYVCRQRTHNCCTYAWNTQTLHLPNTFLFDRTFCVRRLYVENATEYTQQTIMSTSCHNITHTSPNNSSSITKSTSRSDANKSSAAVINRTANRKETHSPKPYGYCVEELSTPISNQFERKNPCKFIPPIQSSKFTPAIRRKALYQNSKLHDVKLRHSMRKNAIAKGTFESY